ncbi:hypothetical protein ACH4U6_34905 [Streptomyces netropsis]|uniref:hypothetical protein n=1 Tax=Streptomyces netropsis TaxID=55404 RepID=UPI0037B4DC50
MATKIRFRAGSSSASGRSNSSIGRMNSDWADLARDLRAADHIAAWSDQHPELGGAQSPQDIIDRLAAVLREGDWRAHDAVLAVLVQRAAAGGFGGDLAWRIAMRALLPKVILMTHSQLRDGVEFDEIVATMLSALCEVVRTYPLERRPRALFSNLSMDTLSLAQTVLAADFDDRSKLREIAQDMVPLASEAPASALMLGEVPEPYEQVRLAELLVRAVELELVSDDEPELTAGAARTELLALVSWAVDIEALSPDEAQRITAYHLSASDAPGRTHRTTRAMGAEGDRIRQRASRAARRLRGPDTVSAYLANAA